jgi:hypothetical protein
MAPMRTSRFAFLPLLVSLLFWNGCASKDFREPEIDGDTEKQVARVVSRSFSDVWDGAITVLAEKKYALSLSKRDAGLIVTDWISGKSDRLYSGYGDTRIPYPVRFKLTIKLNLIRGGVRVVIRNDEQYLSDAISAGTDFDGSLYRWIPTPSSGTKEEALLSALISQLGLSPKDKR